MHITPYLSFDGTAREAITRYHEILGGDLTVISFTEGGAAPEGVDWADKVMHAELTSGDVHLYASDWVPDACGGAPFAPGSDITITLGGGQGDAPALRAAYEQLADGGEVFMPLGRQDWGDEFGSLRDRFGKGWNIAIAGDPAQG